MTRSDLSRTVASAPATVHGNPLAPRRLNILFLMTDQHRRDCPCAPFSHVLA
jgi:hypothetical protein